MSFNAVQCLCLTGSARQMDDGSSIEVGSALISRLAGSDWDSGSVSSSAGQSPLNGTYAI